MKNIYIFDKKRANIQGNPILQSLDIIIISKYMAYVHTKNSKLNKKL